MDNEPLCYICGTSLLPENPLNQPQSKKPQKFKLSFSCNHQICPLCISPFLLKQKYSFLNSETSNKNLIQLTCKCNSKGTVSLSYEELITILTPSTNSINNISKSLCIKHNLYSDRYCKECGIAFCSLCSTSHSEFYKDHHFEDFKAMKCIIHNSDDIISYCKICKVYICNQCNINDHIEHKTYIIDSVRDEICNYTKNLRYKTFDEFSKYFADREIALSDKINNEISYAKNRIESIIELLNIIKSDYITELYDDLYKIGLVFKIVKILNCRYYNDIVDSELNYEHKYKYLAKIKEEITDIKLSFDSSTETFDEIEKIISSLSNRKGINYSIIKSSLDNITLQKDQSGIKSKLFSLNNNTKTFPINFQCERILKGHSWSVLFLIKLNDNKIASSSSDNTIKIWDISFNENNNNNTKPSSPLCTLKSHTESVNYLIQLKNGNLVSCSKDKCIIFWDISTISSPKKLFCLKGHTNVITSLIELPNSNEIISSSFDTNIIIWDYDNKKENFILKGHTKYIYSMILINKDHLASSSFKEIKVWDISMRKKDFDLQGHSGWIYSLTLLKDERMASGSYDKTIIIWNINTREKIGVLNGHTGAIQALLAIEDKLISASWDKTIKVWDKDSEIFKEIGSIYAHSNEVLCLCDLKNGKIASGSDDSLIKIWDLNI